MTDRYYVRIDRDDGSRTFKGAWTFAHCQREAAAWEQSFPTYGVVIIEASSARSEVAIWSRTIHAGERYYPTNDGTELLGSQASPRYGQPSLSGAHPHDAAIQAARDHKAHR